MTKRSIVIFAGIVAVVVLFVVLIVSVTAVARPTSPPHPPSIAGQNAPANAIAINFHKRYDLHCALLGNQLTVFRNCKIIGFTGGERQSNAAGSSGGYSGSYNPYFRAWLVLEKEDGRRAYLPPDSVRFVEESPGNKRLHRSQAVGGNGGAPFEAKGERRAGFANLIVNGDFEQGNTGFTSQYTFGQAGGALGAAGSYDVLTNPKYHRQADINPPNFGDHTTGHGLMFAGNGAKTHNVIVWSETIAVMPNTDYAYSMWITSWFARSPAKFDILFNGVSVGTPTAPSTVGLWQEFSATWNSGSASSVTINIIDTNLADIGSDFAIDDISLYGPVPIAAPAPIKRITNSVGMKLAYIPPGKFLMGQAALDPMRYEVVGRREVTIDHPFYMGVHEVTQKQFVEMMSSNPSHVCIAHGDVGWDWPVERVTWDEANSFCAKLSALPAEKRARRVYRLPTEAEWEYAFRAGSDTSYYFDPRKSDEYAWTKANSGNKLHSVGQLKPNAWGLYDMSGSVWEWCADRQDGKWHEAWQGWGRVLRGGAFEQDVGFLRHWLDPSKRGWTIGFRVVCESPNGGRRP